MFNISDTRRHREKKRDKKSKLNIKSESYLKKYMNRTRKENDDYRQRTGKVLL